MDVGLEKKSDIEVEKVVIEVEVEVEDKDEDEEDVVLPGFRFHPTDEELVGFYLRRKVDKKSISIDIIKQIDIYKYDPWDLPKACTVGSEKEWYFFCLRGRKYRNSIRPNRVTGSGFWKATGIDRPIYPTSDSNDCIGLKKSLVYYRGSAGKGTKTDWMMHEFRLPSANDNTSSPNIQEAEIWTICRIFKRNVSFMKKYTQSWKHSNSKQSLSPADSSSKTSSFESDAGERYRYATGVSGMQPNQGYLTGYYYDDQKNYQLFGGQWNPTVQAPMATLHPNVVAVNPNANEFFKDGNWDELGRITEFMLDTNADTECRYY